MSTPDIIAELAGLAPDAAIEAVRDRKPVTRDQAQASYRALFEPADPGDISIQERFAIASFVAGLHGQPAAVAFYGARSCLDFSAEIKAAQASGPYGAYPTGPLSAEDAAGPVYRPADPSLGPRLTAALAHVHMLVFHPRDADAASLQAMLDAGWSNTAIVTLAQLVAFLAFQLRAAAGLRTLAEASA